MTRRRGIRRADRHERRASVHQSSNLRNRRSVPYYERSMPPEFREYATSELLPLLTFTGRKIPEQHRVTTHCLHNSVLAGSVGDCVGDTRNTSKPGVRLRVRAWDALFAAELVTMQKGSEASGMQTRYLATPQLLDHFSHWPLRYLIELQLERYTVTEQASGDALVQLKARKREGGKVLPIPPDEFDACIGGLSIGAYLEAVEDDIEFINRSNLRHTWEAFRELPDGRLRAFQPNVCLKQIHSGHLMRYARLYTWDASSAQNLSKQERRMIRIDGQPVAELDYAGLHIRMLHHLMGNDPPSDVDVYRPELVMPAASRDAQTQPTARRFVKRATNILLNTTIRQEAIAAVGGLLRGNAESQLWTGLLRREGIAPGEVVARIVGAHPEVKHRFFTEIGAELQTLDGMIMRRILMIFAKEDRPALGIHDSVLCRATDADFADAMMKIQYSAFVDFWPVVKRVC